jgi:O-antigen/teichoic acid export membrane protein
MENQDEEFKNSLKFIAKSSVVVFLGVILSKIFTYVYRIIIARNFGPEEYGLFTLSIMIAGWFIAFSNFGLNNGLVRFIAIFRGKNQKKNIKSAFRFSLKVTLVTNFVSGIILFLLSDIISNSIFNEPGLELFLKFFSLSVPLTVILEIFLAVALGYEEIGWYSFIHKILIGFLRVSLIIILIIFGLALTSIFISYLLAIFIGLIASILLLATKFRYIFTKDHNQKNEGKLFKKIASYSWPLLFYGIIWQIFHWTDSFVIGLFKTAADVGIYNAAVPLAFLLTAGAQTFLEVFFPIINRENAKKNYKTVEALSKQVGKWIFMINLPILALLIIFPGEFLNALFGSEFLGAKNSLRLLAIGTMFLSVSNISNRLIAMGGRSKIILFDVLFVFIVNLILNITLIPKYGITGAAFSTMASLITLSVIFTFQSRYYFSVVPLKRKMMNLSIAALISTTLLIYLRTQLPQTGISIFMLSSFFIIFYTLLSLFLKGFDKNDMMALKNTIKKYKP